MKYFILSFSIIAITVFASQSWAQSQESETGLGTLPTVDFNENSFSNKQEKFRPSFSNNSAIDKTITIMDESDVTIVEDRYAGKYMSPSIENLSKLYWAKGILDIGEDEAIDNFLFINECELYKEFFKDDFEWSRIREEARKMLLNKKDTFSSQYKFIVPIDLGQYDLDRKGFPLINKTAFKELRRVEVGGGENEKVVCGETLTIKHYPRSIIMILNKPFNLEFLEVDEHIAQAFLIRRKYNEFETAGHARYSSFNRIAFARVRMNITNFRGPARGRDHQIVNVLFGSVEGVDIFEDPYEKRLLKSIDYN